MKLPEAIRAALAKRYRNQQRNWLRGLGDWPLALSLDCPTEREAQSQPDATRAWAAAWRTWKGTGELTWCERQWRALGTQRLPEQILLRSPEEVVAWVDDAPRWRRARTNYLHFVARWPALTSDLARYFNVLAEYTEVDIHHLESLIAWLEANPRSNLYPRQLPVIGLDSKWLEERRPLIADLIALVQGDSANKRDFYERCGLKPLPRRVRAMVLDPAARKSVGGLRDLDVPLDELANTALPVRRIYIVENLQTGLAFGDLPESIVFMGLGYSVGLLAQIPWVVDADCVYWGDVDTHGFAILNRARMHLPRVRSLLMDEHTLLKYRQLWGTEIEQSRATRLPLLTAPEHAIYDALKRNKWRESVRLEQERISWNDAWQLLECS